MEAAYYATIYTSSIRNTFKQKENGAAICGAPFTRAMAR